jgi:hypothetical protein
MKLKILVTILAISTMFLAYTVWTMPDPYQYGQCPEGYKLKNVVTSCQPTKDVGF